MKVFVAQLGDWPETSDIVGVYSTEELAMEAIARLQPTTRPPYLWSIDEYDVDGA